MRTDDGRCAALPSYLPSCKALINFDLVTGVDFRVRESTPFYFPFFEIKFFEIKHMEGISIK
jgi:hypothetical protein